MLSAGLAPRNILYFNTRKSMVEEQSVTVLLSNAYEKLKCVDLRAATELLERALAVDFESPEVLWSLKCANFWAERSNRLEALPNPFERGEFAVAQWKAFASFVAKLEGDFEPALFSFKRFAFSLALSQYEALAPEEKESHEADLALRIGICLKGTGDYVGALRSLETAARERKEDAEVLAELADTYALQGDERSSKALFREAFFIAPQRIEIELLESGMIRRLAAKVAALGYRGPELAEWIPVYGTLLGVFGVKRELKAVEVGKLRQSIYQLENESKEGGDERALRVPRLINRYFWLIDHYIAAKEDRSKIDEVLLKVRLLDQSVYKQYTA
jgi:tetratricopeptide (TPR) repeat protein